jgi:anti-sigma factor RsiW
MSEQGAGQGAWRWNDPAQEAERQQRHEVLIDLLGAYVDGELPAETASQLDAHLVGCARCRREVQLQHSLRAHLARVPVEPATPRLRDGLLAAIATTPSTSISPPGVGRPFVEPTPAVLPAPRNRRLVTLIVALTVVLLAIAGWGISSVRDRAPSVAVTALDAPARSIPLLAEAVADYQRVSASDLPGPARDLAAVRAATGLPVEPISNPAVRLIGAWTTTLGGETVAVLAYRWDDRTIVQYIVPDQLFFRHPALRSAAAAHRAVTVADDTLGIVAWPVAAAGAVLVGDGSPERLLGALVR